MMRFKVSAVSALLAATALFAGVANNPEPVVLEFDYSLNGRHAGTLTTRITELEGGYRNTVNRYALLIEERSIDIRVRERHRPDGSPEYYELTVTDPSTELNVIADFNAEGAQIRLIQGGSTTEMPLRLPAGATAVNPAKYWVARAEAPPVGTEAEYYDFDIQELTWEPVSMTYRGQREVTLRGQSRTVHVIDRIYTRTGETAEIWLDDNGWPLRMDITARDGTRNLSERTSP